MNEIEDILEQIENGSLSAKDAMELIGSSMEKDLCFAKVDVDRPRRRGMPEAVFCPGKTTKQIIEIMTALQESGQDVLATRATPEQYEAVGQAIPDAIYDATSRIITVDTRERSEPIGLVVVVSAGTADIPVAEEAAITAERMGARVERVYDVGVAGLHRLMKHLSLLRTARAIIVVAGMEGALPSVVGGLVDCPIVAVPTSVGYGTGLNGFTPLLAMLNTCVPGITVVNVDNGFGAGVAAAMINRGPDLAQSSERQAGTGKRQKPVDSKSSTQKIID